MHLICLLFCSVSSIYMYEQGFQGMPGYPGPIGEKGPPGPVGPTVRPRR